jgi:hypothetical protein
MLNRNSVHQGDCLEVMNHIDAGSVDDLSAAKSRSRHIIWSTIARPFSLAARGNSKPRWESTISKLLRGYPNPQPGLRNAL